MSDKYVKGLTKTLKSLKKFGEEADKEIDAVAKGVSDDISLSAKQKAPINIGKLAQSISSPAQKLDQREYKVAVLAEHAPYVEFGTGSKVKVPAEFAEMAAKFKGKKGGSFEKGLKSIRDWCRAKGIPEESAYPILMAILKKGINPQPFLYPAYLNGKKAFPKELKKLLDRLTKKYN